MVTAKPEMKKGLLLFKDSCANLRAGCVFAETPRPFVLTAVLSQVVRAGSKEVVSIGLNAAQSSGTSMSFLYSLTA